MSLTLLDLLAWRTDLFAYSQTTKTLTQTIWHTRRRSRTRVYDSNLVSALDQGSRLGGISTSCVGDSRGTYRGCGSALVGP